MQIKLLILVSIFQITGFSQVVDWCWSGALTSNSVVISAKTTAAQDGKTIRIRAAKTPDFATGIVFSDNVVSDAAKQYIIKCSLTGLSPFTQYYYRAETLDGTVETVKIGKVKTFPVENSVSSFQIISSSCNSGTTGDAAIFSTIKSFNPLLFIHCGDFHYNNISQNDPALYRAAVESRLVLRQADLYQNVPIAYIWDDHDFGPNDSYGGSHGKPAAHSVYRQYIPHYPLAGADTTAIYQAFTLGRVRVIMTDLRSDAAFGNLADGPTKLIMGAVQKQWFKDQLLAAKNANQVVLWVSTRPWIGTGSLADQWWGFSYERRDIAKFIYDNGINKLFMVAGDMHGLAIDNGTHNGYYNDNTTDGSYATTTGNGFVVFQTSALTSNGSTKGGPWSEGSNAGNGQFGLINVIDYTDSIVVNLEGRNAAGLVNDIKYKMKYLMVDVPLPVIQPITQTAIVNNAFSIQLTSTGTDLPFTWTSTNLPNGVSLSNSGLLTGSISTVGAANLDVTVTDANNDSDTKSLTLNVTTPPTTIVIQGEDFTLKSTDGFAELGSTYNTGWTGTGYFDSGSSLTSFGEWTTPSMIAGNYNLTVTYASGNNRAHNLTINGVPAGSNAFVGTGGFSIWKDVVFSVTLKAGINIIRLTNTIANGVNIDKLTLTSANVITLNKDVNNRIELFQNPVNNQLFIANSSPADQVIIYDILGSQRINTMLSTQGSIDVSALSPNVYFVRILKNGNVVYEKKMLKK